MKRKPLPPPPRERGVSPPVSPRPPPPPIIPRPPTVSKEKEFALNVNEKPMTSEALLSRIPSISNTNSNSNSEPEFISRAPSMSNAEQDPFFIAAKNYVIKKLELEVLKEELESAKYEETLKTPEYSKIYPKLENIYKKHKGLTLDDFVTVSVEDIGTKIKEKEAELVELEKEYANKPSSPDKLQSEIITFNDTLDSYIENKTKIMAIIPVIETEINKGIPIRNKLVSKIEEYEDRTKHKTNETQKNDIENDWVPHYEKYVELHEKISNLLNIEVFLDRNNELYGKLNQHSKYIDQGLFHKVIYNNLDLLKLFQRLGKNVSEILKDYSSGNDFFMKKIDNVALMSSKTPISKYSTNLSIPLHVRDKRKLEKRNKELQAMIDDLTTKFNSSVELRVKEISEELETTQGKLSELIKLQESSEEEKQKMVEEMNKKLSESEQKYQDEMAKLKEKNEEENGELMEQMTEDQENLRREIERLKGLLNAKPEELKQQIETKQEELKVQQETNEFLLLAIKAADLYEKEGFKEGFVDLLNYQPDDKFMFDYAFSQIEQEKGKYEYLDDFLRNPVKMPDQIYTDQLIPQIKGTLAFRPILQIH
jgi:hypothetical protein